MAWKEIMVYMSLTCVRLKITGGATLIFDTELVEVLGKTPSEGKTTNSEL